MVRKHPQKMSHGRFRYMSLYLGIAKHLSVISKMRFKTCLRFNQVNLRPKNPEPRTLQESNQSLNLKGLLIFTCLLPNLYSPHKASL